MAIPANGPVHGTLNLSGNGSFGYKPAAGFHGQDSFTYAASDGTVTSNAATVTITVTPKVLFTSTRDGNPEIYVMRADGTAPTRLTVNSLIDATPAWSPDATRIAFARGGGSRWGIYAMNADGTAQTALTSGRAIDATPAWGPDGRIAFSSTRDGNAEIYVMPATGEAGCQKACTIAKRLTTNPAIDTSPTWLGTRIAFSSTRDDPNSEIYVMNADGTALTRLTVNSAIDATPAGSPDGQRIAFASTRDDPNSEVYVMQADGTAVTRLTTSPASDAFPDW